MQPDRTKKQLKSITAESIEQPALQTQAGRVGADQGSHLQQLAGAALSLAAWDEAEQQEADDREKHLPESNSVGDGKRGGGFIYSPQTHHKDAALLWRLYTDLCRINM